MRVALLSLHVQADAGENSLVNKPIGRVPPVKLRLKCKTSLNRLRMRLGIADRIWPERRRVMHHVARIQRPAIGIPNPDVTGTMSRQVNDL